MTASHFLPFVRRPWKTIRLDICTVTQYLSIFAKYFTGFRKREKYGRKISRKVKLKVFCSNPRSSGFPLKSVVSCRLLSIFLLLEDHERPSDLDISTVTQYLSIFTNYFTGFRNGEKYVSKVSRKMKLKVFCKNPMSSGIPIEIFCFMTGF